MPHEAVHGLRNRSTFVREGNESTEHPVEGDFSAVARGLRDSGWTFAVCARSSVITSGSGASTQRKQPAIELGPRE